MTGLLELAGVLRRRAWLIVLTTLLATGVAIVATLMKPPLYSATTTLHLDTDALTAGGLTRLDSTSLQRILNTYAELGESDSVVESVEADLGISLDDRVDASPMPNTDLIEVQVDASRPTLAVQGANAVAAGLLERIREITAQRAEVTDDAFNREIAVLTDEIAADQQRFDELQASGQTDPATQVELSQLQAEIAAGNAALTQRQQQREQQRISDLNSQNALSVFEEATEAVEASSSGILVGAVGLVLGLLGGVGLALVFERLNPRFNTADELEHAAAVVSGTSGDLIIGRIPPGLSLSRESISSDRQLDTYQRIWMRIFGSNGHSAVRSVLLTSADEGDQKTAVAVHLAASLARLGRRTLIVDGDLRRPKLASVFGVDNAVGLTGVLRGTTEPEDAIVATDIPYLSVLPAGPDLGAPDKLLARERLTQVMRHIGTNFDQVVVDSPDLVKASDALLLAGAADSVILVASPRLRRSGLRSVIEDFQHVRASFLGVITTAEGMDHPLQHEGGKARARSAR